MILQLQNFPKLPIAYKAQLNTLGLGALQDRGHEGFKF